MSFHHLFSKKVPFSEGRMAACPIILLKVATLNPFVRKAAENLTKNVAFKPFFSSNRSWKFW